MLTSNYCREAYYHGQTSLHRVSSSAAVRKEDWPERPVRQTSFQFSAVWRLRHLATDFAGTEGSAKSKNHVSKHSIRGKIVDMSEASPHGNTLVPTALQLSATEYDGSAQLRHLSSIESSVKPVECKALAERWSLSKARRKGSR